jgi:hypothetical protein
MHWQTNINALGAFPECGFGVGFRNPGRWHKYIKEQANTPLFL